MWFCINPNSSGHVHLNRTVAGWGRKEGKKNFLFAHCQFVDSPKGSFFLEAFQFLFSTIYTFFLREKKMMIIFNCLQRREQQHNNKRETIHKPKIKNFPCRCMLLPRDKDIRRLRHHPFNSTYLPREIPNVFNAGRCSVHPSCQLIVIPLASAHPALRWMPVFNSL